MIYSTNNDRIDQMETQLRTGYDTNIKHQVEIIVSELDGIMNQVNAGVINNTQAEKIAATMDTQADLMRGIQENSTDLKKISDLMKELVQRFRI
jgi:methyl-accepting chemotaxis protein